MFQSDQLFEWRNILNNVVIGLEIQGKLNKNLETAKDMLINYGLRISSILILINYQVE